MTKHLILAFRPAKVTCGDWKLDATDTDEQSLVVSSVVNHPSYNAATFENDIAVIKVTGTMTCTQGKIWPACLPNTAVNIEKTNPNIASQTCVDILRNTHTRAGPTPWCQAGAPSPLAGPSPTRSSMSRCPRCLTPPATLPTPTMGSSFQTR